MAPTSAGVSMVEQDHKNYYQQPLIPWGMSQLPPTSLGGSPGSAAPDAFQIASFVLERGVSEFLHISSKYRILVFYCSLALFNIRPDGFQIHMFWVLIFLMQDPWAGGPNVGPRPLNPWGGPLQL